MVISPRKASWTRPSCSQTTQTIMKKIVWKCRGCSPLYHSGFACLIKQEMTKLAFRNFWIVERFWVRVWRREQERWEYEKAKISYMRVWEGYAFVEVLLGQENITYADDTPVKLFYENGCRGFWWKPSNSRERHWACWGFQPQYKASMLRCISTKISREQSYLISFWEKKIFIS